MCYLPQIRSSPSFTYFCFVKKFQLGVCFFPSWEQCMDMRAMLWEILIQNKLFAPAQIILPFFRTGENVLVLNSSSLMVVAVVVVKWLFHDGCRDGFLITMQISHVVLPGVKHLKKENLCKIIFSKQWSMQCKNHIWELDS